VQKSLDSDWPKNNAKKGNQISPCRLMQLRTLWKTNSCKLIPNCTRNHFITYTKHLCWCVIASKTKKEKKTSATKVEVSYFTTAWFSYVKHNPTKFYLFMRKKVNKKLNLVNNQQHIQINCDQYPKFSNNQLRDKSHVFQSCKTDCCKTWSYGNCLQVTFQIIHMIMHLQTKILVRVHWSPW